MIEALPPPSTLVVVESADDHSPQIFMGFTAGGDEQARVRLQDAANRLNIPAEPCPFNDSIGIMVAYPPGGDKSAELQFYRDAIAGKFGKLDVELALMPVARAVAGGTIEDDGYAISPAGIILPPQAPDNRR
jgi:hypothetical protein